MKKLYAVSIMAGSSDGVRYTHSAHYVFADTYHDAFQQAKAIGNRVYANHPTYVGFSTDADEIPLERSSSAMQINLDVLFGDDRLVFFPIPRDNEVLANMSVADVKALSCAINVLNDRVLGLLKDLERAEERIDALEREK